jgi:hypothetical protein
MKYSEAEILDILKLTCDNAEEVLLRWNINKANTPVKVGYAPHFVYTFPLIVDDIEVAQITLAGLHGVNGRHDLMQKYFGHEDNEKSWAAFSHDTYLWCYFTHDKEFQLPKIVKGLRGQSFIGKDVKGNDFEFKVSYGYPEKEKDSHQYAVWIDDAYRFDNGVAIKIDAVKEGWELGKKINQNIKVRVRDQKISDVIDVTL